MTIKLRLALYNSILPLILGAFIYISFRSNSLLMFRWFNLLHLDFVVVYLRKNIYFHIAKLPSWLIYSLPDALWVYSLISTIFIIWGMDFLKMKFWLTISLLIAPLLEFLQFLKLFPGTFDIIDLLFYLIGSILSLTIVKYNLKENEKQNY